MKELKAKYLGDFEALILGLPEKQELLRHYKDENIFTVTELQADKCEISACIDDCIHFFWVKKEDLLII